MPIQGFLLTASTFYEYDVYLLLLLIMFFKCDSLSCLFYFQLLLAYILMLPVLFSVTGLIPSFASTLIIRTEFN
jgi:hypothetical protein